MQVGYAKARIVELLDACCVSVYETRVVDRSSDIPNKIWRRGVFAFELLSLMDRFHKDHEWFYLLNDAGIHVLVIDIEMTKYGLLLTFETAQAEQLNDASRQRWSFFG